MIRTTAVPRPVRVGAAMAGVAGILTLAACAGTTPEAESTPVESSATASATPSESATTSAPTSTYSDGTYSAEGSYATPETIETITVTVTLQEDVITAVEVVGNPQKAESERYQGEFIGGIADVVVGQDIDQIAVSRVAGSSLTSGGFNQAIETIKAEAAA